LAVPLAVTRADSRVERSAAWMELLLAGRRAAVRVAHSAENLVVRSAAGKAVLMVVCSEPTKAAHWVVPLAGRTAVYWVGPTAGQKADYWVGCSAGPLVGSKAVQRVARWGR